MIFSDHALQRCKEQGIHPHTIEREVKNLPGLRGTVTWRTKHKHLVVLRAKDQNTIVVVTVMANWKHKPKAYEKQARRIKLKNDKKD